ASHGQVPRDRPAVQHARVQGGVRLCRRHADGPAGPRAVRGLVTRSASPSLVKARRASAIMPGLERAWARTDALFGLVAPDALLAQPIALRQPFIFYLGHLPAFAWNQVCRLVLGHAAFAPERDVLFERGIDPPDVADYRDRVRRELRAALPEAVEGGRADLVQRVLEHEWMHQETLLYMLLQLPHD